MSRVLIVDDNAVIARLLVRLLEIAGHDGVDVSDDPAQLIDPGCSLWLGADALVCDLRMPQVSGFELLAVAVTYFPSIRRILFTGLSEHDQEVKDAAKLADRVLFKPDGAAQLRTVLEELSR
jgi:two-component system response regulator HydG